MGISNILKGVSQREKTLIYVAIFFIFIFLIYQLVFVPLLRAREEFDRERVELESRFQQLKLLADRYMAQKNAYDSLREMLKDKGSLPVLTYLENTSTNAGVRGNIEYIKPRGQEVKNGLLETKVEIKINALPIQNLMLFLYRMEEGRKGLIVTYLRLKPFFKEKEKADVLVGITDFEIR